MKKIYPVFLLVFFCIACSNDFDESTQTESSVVANTTYTTANSITALDAVVWQLVTTYNSNNTETSKTLSQTITLLDSISNLNSYFLELKPTNYTTITTTNAQKFVTNYNEEFQLLATSLTVKAYYAQMIEDDVNWVTMLQTISNDNQLNATEKSSLLFMGHILKGNPPYGDDDEPDDMWRKNKIVAAHLGFTESSAQAIFNVALAIIYQP